MKGFKCDPAATPFIDEDEELNPSRSSAIAGLKPNQHSGGLVCPGCCEAFRTEAFKPVNTPEDASKECKIMRYGQAKALVEGKDLEIAGPNEAKQMETGILTSIAAMVLMKVFYCSRYVRFDLLRAITFLACQLTKWTDQCDRRLHRLMCYVKWTIFHEQVNWIGDQLIDLRLHLYADANFAG